MKIIAVEINIEHEPMEEEAAAGLEAVTPLREEFSLALTQEIPDDEPAGPHVEQLVQELLRRHQFLNARKTN